MKKRLIYAIVKRWIKTALFFSFRKIKVNGKHNVPKKGPVIILANHQNTLIDPLILACYLPHTFNFLLRASFFNSNAGKSIAKNLNMWPIYRPRDGADFAEKNQAVFDACVTMLNNNETILIFPEGSHLGKWTLRPFQKGFARIAHAFLEQAGDNTELTILPTGLNYFNLKWLGDKVVVNVGEPITMSKSDLTDIAKFSNSLKQRGYEAVAELMLNIPDTDTYDAQEKRADAFLQSTNNSNKALSSAMTEFNSETRVPNKRVLKFRLTNLLWPIHILAHLIAKQILKNIKDPQFQPSVYMMVSLVVHTLTTLLLFIYLIFR